MTVQKVLNNTVQRCERDIFTLENSAATNKCPVPTFSSDAIKLNYDDHKKLLMTHHAFRETQSGVIRGVAQ